MRCAAMLAFFSLTVLMMVAGCSREPTRYDVQGTVTVDGKALDSGDISFNPEDSKANPETPMATVTDGKYSTEAPRGKYKVTVIITPAPEGAPRKFHKKYEDIGSTTLSVEVVENAAPGAYDLKLTKK